MYCIMFMVHRIDVENLWDSQDLFYSFINSFILMSFFFDLPVMSKEKWDGNHSQWWKG